MPLISMAAGRVLPVKRSHDQLHGPANSHAGKSPLARVRRAAATITQGKQIHLWREKIAARLLLEADMQRGLRRLVNQILICLFTMTALKVGGGGGQDMKRGIYNHLRTNFYFDGFSKTQSRAALKTELLPQLAGASKRHFLLGSRYFDYGLFGDVELVGDLQVYTSSRVLPGLHLNMDVSAFTFSAWVRVGTDFNSGYIIRKVPSKGLGDDHEVCWGWKLEGDRGPGLHYGAHDSAPPAFNLPNVDQVFVSPDKAVRIADAQFHLLTVVINSTKVTFYVDKTSFGPYPLPRPVTDCNNNHQGIQIGSPGLSMRQLRFYIGAFQPEEVHELFNYGQRLADISTGSDPFSKSSAELNEAMMQSSIDSTMAETAAQTQALSSSQSEVITILRALDDQAGITQNYKSPIYPVGKTRPSSYSGVDHHVASRVIHQTKNRSYFSVISEPSRLSRTSSADARLLEHLPRFNGTGATFSYWYRHPKENGGLYLFWAFDSASAVCWSLWVEDGAIWFDNPNGKTSKFAYLYFKDYGMEDEFFFRSDRTWRHVVLQFDELTDRVKFYLDGVLVVSHPFDSSVRHADCTGNDRMLAIGHSAPGYTYGKEVEIYDLRLYRHGDEGPLSDLDIAGIARAPTPFEERDQCVMPSNEKLQEAQTKSPWGHDCTWFHRQYSMGNTIVCKLAGLTEMCPIACKAYQLCYHKEVYDSYQLWNSTRLINAMLEGGRGRRKMNGTLCLSSHLNKEAVYNRCVAWRKLGPGAKGGRGVSAPDDKEIEEYLTNMNVNRLYPRLNVTECEELADAVDEHCSFDSAQVQGFTRDLRAQGGNYTIAFWIKPAGNGALNKEGRFHPTVTFWSNLSKPQQQLSLGLWYNPNGELRTNTACHPGSAYARDVFENIEMLRASETEWTMLALVKDNTSNFTTVFTNLGSMREQSGVYQCLYNDSFFFEALEFNFPVVMSPVYLVPRALETIQVQRQFMNVKPEMLVRTGPTASDQARASYRIPVVKRDYDLKTTLLGPPIIFQTRTQASKRCPASEPREYTSKYLHEVHGKAMKERCAEPFNCDTETLQNQESVLSCRGNDLTDANDTQFGQAPIQFGAESGWPDFLFSVTENEALFRGGDLMQTSSLIDSSTKVLKVILAFFTPQYGATTIVEMKADMGTSEAVTTSIKVQHYHILEGSARNEYIFFQVLVLFNLPMLFYDGVLAFNKIRSAYQSMHRQHKEAEQHGHAGVQPPRLALDEMITPLVDIATALVIVIFVGWNMKIKLDSAAKTKEIAGAISGIEWANPSVAMDRKWDTYLTSINTMLGLISEQEFCSNLANVILYVNLVRLIQCTELHPRLAILKNTMSLITEDVIHAGILLMTLVLLFGSMGTWFFGEHRDDFATLYDSVCTQAMMVLGGAFPEDWNRDVQLAIYTIALFILLMIFMLNFLLAIIVDGYVTVASRSKGSHVEHSFVSDVFASLETWYLAYTNKWPDVRVLAGLLNEDGVRELTTIDFEFLTKMRHSSLAFGLTAQERKYVSNNEGDQIQDVAPEQLQRKEISIIKWLQHYGRFDALIAPTVGDNFFNVATRVTQGHRLSKTIRARMSAEQERVADAIQASMKKVGHDEAFSSKPQAAGEEEVAQQDPSPDAETARTRHNGTHLDTSRPPYEDSQRIPGVVPVYEPENARKGLQNLEAALSQRALSVGEEANVSEIEEVMRLTPSTLSKATLQDDACVFSDTEKNA